MDGFWLIIFILIFFTRLFWRGLHRQHAKQATPNLPYQGDGIYLILKDPHLFPSQLGDLGSFTTPRTQRFLFVVLARSVLLTYLLGHSELWDWSHLPRRQLMYLCIWGKIDILKYQNCPSVVADDVKWIDENAYGQVHIFKNTLGPFCVFQLNCSRHALWEAGQMASL